MVKVPIDQPIVKYSDQPARDFSETGTEKHTVLKVTEMLLLLHSDAGFELQGLVFATSEWSKCI